MKNVNKFLVFLSVTLACFTAASSVAYAAVAGHVQFVNGDVQIISPAGQARPLQKGDAVNEGDTLTSAPAASAQIKMQDGGFVAMRPDTSLKFDQFVFSGKQDGSEKSFFSLFKGGFRAVTGLIGQINKQNYKITTPAATIGIRGTDHETMLITPGSPMALVAPAGAYSKVNVGETTLTTNRGVINVMPNQMGFAGGMDQAPKLQPLNTNIFTVAAAPSLAAKTDKKEEKEKTEAKQEQKTAKSEEKKEGGEKSKQESAATESNPASTEQAASTSTEKAPVVAAAPQETVAPLRTTAVVDAVAPAAGLIPGTVAPVMAAPVALALVIAPPPTTPQNVQITTVPQNGTTLNLTTGTATTSTGQVVIAQLPTMATCTANPAVAGCSAVLPSLATCTVNPAAAGCTAVLPSLVTCTANPAAAGCTAVLPTIATCSADPAAAGCTAVLPTIATCSTNPTAAGCTAVLPTIATCSTNPAAAGCTVVLPTQSHVQTDVSVETSVNNGYGIYYGPMFYSGNGNSMTAAANVAPLATTPSFTMNYGCINCGADTVTLPGATGAVNGNANSFATTGIQFGRWTSAPNISQTSVYPFAPGQNNIGNSSSDWVFAPGGYLDTPTTLSAATGGTTAGVFNYVLSGVAPAPKDQNGVAGTLNTLSLAANFATQTVTAALSASLGATTWTANSAAMGIGAFNGTSAGFGGTLNVTSSNASVSTYGYLNGAFTGQNYAGTIVDYTIQEWPLAGGITTSNLYGVAALTRNGVAGNATVANGTAAPTGNFVVAESGWMSGSFLQTATAITSTAGVLTSYSTNNGAGSTSTNTIVCTNCTGQAAPDAATGIQYGTWDSGSRSYSYTSPFSGQFHWITGPGLDPVYLPEVLTGTMAYTLDGGTVPTNQNGVAGSLSSASLAVNFTSQTVDIALGLTGVNGHSWTASSTGTPLNWTNYSKNGFSANSGMTQGSSLSVLMDGATTGIGYLSGQLTGSGLNGALFQYQLSAPLPMPTVPGNFTATDMVTAQAPSVTVTGPLTTGGTVNVAFPAGTSGTLVVQPATTLSVVLAGGVPITASLSGGVAASVPNLTADPVKTGVYYGTAATGESVAVDTYAWAYNARYSNFGEWRTLPMPAGLAPVTATGPFTSGEFAGGMLLTPATSMPVSNFAVNGYYYGAMVGGVQNSANNTPYSLSNGWLALNANFTTGTLSGSATNIQVRDQSTGSFAGYFNDLSLAAAITTNAFSGSVTANAAPTGTTASPVNLTTGTTGTTSGHFYGPNANELTGIFGLTSGTIKASGAFGAGNGTSNSTPFETVNGTVALVAAAPANTATPYRLIGMSAYDPAPAAFNTGMVIDGGYNNTARVTEDVAGNVTVFDSGFGNGNTNYNNSPRLAINTATPTGLGTDPVSGISWGRWVGGSINITDRTTGVVTPSVNADSLHWIAGPSMTAPVALPTTGTYTYVLAGGTAPTDNLGNVGTLNSASLVANFTTQMVNVGVNVGITNVSGAATLNASATNVPIQQRSMFDARTAGMGGASSGLLSATCTGAGCSAVSPVQAKIGGAFTGATGQGAAMTYGFNNGSTVVNGVAAFHR